MNKDLMLHVSSRRETKLDMIDGARGIQIVALFLDEMEYAAQGPSGGMNVE